MLRCAPAYSDVKRFDIGVVMQHRSTAWVVARGVRVPERQVNPFMVIDMPRADVLLIFVLRIEENAAPTPLRP